MKNRHRIEEKNGELKETHRLRRADSRELFAMELQMYITAFVANVKRITRLTELVCSKGTLFLACFGANLYTDAVYIEIRKGLSGNR